VDLVVLQPLARGQRDGGSSAPRHARSAGFAADASLRRACADPSAPSGKPTPRSRSRINGRPPQGALGRGVSPRGRVEPLDCGIEARPELVWTAPSRPRAQLIWRSRALRTLDRSPGKPGVQRARVGVAHRGRRFRQRPQTRAKAGVRWRLLVGPRRVCPRRPRVADRAPRPLLRAYGAGPTPRLGNLAHPTFLPHITAALYATVPNRCLGTRTVRTDPSAAKPHRRTHTTVLM
jgi:hypothetical protein